MSESDRPASVAAGDLPPMDVAARLVRLRTALLERDLDGFIVTKQVNVRWLTGFTGSNGQLAITPDRMVLVTDGRYTDQAEAETGASGAAVEIEIATAGGDDIVASVLGSLPQVGFESGHLTVLRHRELAEVLGSATLEPTGPVIEQLRQDKDQGEIARLRRASQIADQAFADVLPLLADRPTERRFGAELDHHMRLAGAEGVSFETIVGSGPNGALPHARPSDRIIGSGDLVVLDFGARVDGYGSDMSRTVVAGGDPSQEQIDLYDAVASAQRRGVAAVRAGVEEVEIDRACRTALAEDGLADAFIHGTGHGIGLEIHEQPILSARSVGILRAGLVVTVEPGAYLPGFGGVRVEDSVVVTADGCEPITRSPKGLVPSFPASRQDHRHGHDHQ